MDGYNKLHIIGKGTFGVVYLCGRKNSKRKIVLKEINTKLNPKGKKAAKNEIKILKYLAHPNIIQYYTHFICPTFICIVMEHATKGNLFEMIEKRRNANNSFIPQQEVLNIYCQIVLAVDYLHSNKIIHRDLKSENILITGTKYDVVKVADFGISKKLHSDTHTNSIIGTPNYLAPEICDEKSYDTKSDIWSLGCILYELCALEKMFDGTLSNIVLSIANKKIKTINLEIYEAELQNIINMNLTVNPADRPNITDLLHSPFLMPVTFKLLSDLGQILP